MSTELESPEALVRIRVPLDAGAGAGPADDWLWAEPLGSDRFRVESCPFFAYGVSRDDVVRAAGPEEGPVLADVLEKGGHRTLRFALDASVDLQSTAVQRLLERVGDAGCTYELLRPRYVAIDVPPEVDLAVLADVLQDAARKG